MTDHDYYLMFSDIMTLINDKYGTSCKNVNLSIGKSEILKKETITLSIDIIMNGTLLRVGAIKGTINEVMAEIDKQLSCPILEKHYL